MDAWKQPGLYSSTHAAGASSSSCDTDTVFKNAAARRRPRLQGRQERGGEKRQSEGGREGAKPDWMVAAAPSQALAQQTWAVLEEDEAHSREHQPINVQPRTAEGTFIIQKMDTKNKSLKEQQWNCSCL